MATNVTEDTPRFNVHISLPESSSNFSFEALPDTGSTASVISSDLALENNFPIDSSIKPLLLNASDLPMDVLGITEVDLTYCGISVGVKLIVTTDMVSELLVDWKTLIKLGILPPDFPNPVRVNKVDTSSYLRRYSDVFDDSTLKPMAGDPMKIHLDHTKDIKPVHIVTPRKLPIHFYEGAKRVLDDYVKKGIIRPVTWPTTFCSPCQFVSKKDDPQNLEPRLVADLSGLNKYVKRPVHPFPSVEDIRNGIPASAKVFCKLDATKGYWQVALDEESMDLTTFLTPFGRFQYCRAPMGLSSSGDEFCQRSDKIIEGITGTFKIVDDIIISATDFNELHLKIEKVLQNCRRFNITLSKNKMVISNSVPFAGLIISDEGIRPDPDKLAAIKSFPVPKNITDMRSFFGLANQLRQFVPNLSELSAPLRHLIRPKNTFIWSNDCQLAFDNVKDALVQPCLLHHYDPSRDTFLLTDASKLNGLGFALMQKQESEEFLIICGSRNISDAEKRYAPIELEAVAICWAILKCRLYLLGGYFTVVTDHRPLLGIFSKRDTENTRLRRVLDKLAPYTFDVKWIQGKDHLIADALSRAPILPATDDESFNNVRRITGHGTKDLIQSAVIDEDYVAIIDFFRTGKPISSVDTHHPARQYLNIWDNISLEDDLLFYNERIIVPQNYRKSLLKLLHESHCGITRTLKLARQHYYWPSLTSDITNMINSCLPCQRVRPSQSNEYEPNTTSATFPMEHLSMDLFTTGGKDYLIIIDRFSGYPFVEKFGTTTATSAVIKRMETIFHLFGYPLVIRSDNGPQFRTEFKEYCAEHNIIHDTSSPFYPESNGHAEAGVKNVKTLLEKYQNNWNDFDNALLEWRKMPKANKESPYELMFGRRGIGKLPTPEHLPMREAKFAVGDRVFVQSQKTRRWDDVGTIVSIRPTLKSYEVELNGKIYVRNQRYLRPYNVDHSDDH